MIDARIEKAVKFMEEISKGNHGYDQRYRWGERGDYDCSSLTITAFQNAGIPLKDYGATYTGDMSQALKKLGFKNVISKVNLNTGENLQRGDILLNIYYHVAVYVGNGKVVQASVNELGTAIGGKAGDQTGKEIEIKPYYLYKRGWNEVWRFEQELRKSEAKLSKGDNEMVEVITIKRIGKDGKVTKPTVNRILKDGVNYFNIRDLEKLGIFEKVDFDKAANQVIIEEA